MKKIKKEKPTQLSKASIKTVVRNLIDSKERGFTKPKFREDCKDVVRPCPYITCRYNLFLDVEDNGAIRFNQRTKDPTAVKSISLSGKEVYPSCTLDMVEMMPNGISNDDIGRILGGISRETVRLLAKKILLSLRTSLDDIGYNSKELAVSTNEDIIEALGDYLEESNEKPKQEIP